MHSGLYQAECLVLVDAEHIGLVRVPYRFKALIIRRESALLLLFQGERGEREEKGKRRGEWKGEQVVIDHERGPGMYKGCRHLELSRCMYIAFSIFYHRYFAFSILYLVNLPYIIWSHYFLGM